jgi:hypothetical protein
MKSLSCDEVRELAVPYVLGGLDRSTSAAVREHLAGHPGGHPEFAEFGGIAPALAYLSDPISPPAALKGRVLAAAAATEQEALTRDGVATVASTVREPRDRIERQWRWQEALTPRRVAVARWAFAAAAIVSIVALVFANAALQRDVSSSRQFNDQMNRAVALAGAPGSRLAVIGPAGGSAGSGTSSGPTGLAVIPRDGPGILVMQGLAATDGSQVYEAWAIVGSQAPVPIGSFGVGGDGFGWLAELTGPAGGDIVVALTREPGPGATKPTLPIVASGTAASRPSG